MLILITFMGGLYSDRRLIKIAKNLLALITDIGFKEFIQREILEGIYDTSF
ncbi:hypothetical protein H6F42_09755 [Pseudanabaena sp. FACHB-1998]|uniref:hypothetical protein n=1 Tax=Pseudanabaena sp. FACHB-1998 TaxID=2692858 RepID=UPI0016800F91|nr:hypothetical protein [Pseudanabaena sp. FACHB-1998]MBD2177194.1 hypothetical protein [Pseudanabaena sp. FACHB-1998]